MFHERLHSKTFLKRLAFFSILYVDGTTNLGPHTCNHIPSSRNLDSGSWSAIKPLLWHGKNMQSDFSFQEERTTPWTISRSGLQNFFRFPGVASSAITACFRRAWKTAQHLRRPRWSCGFMWFLDRLDSNKWITPKCLPDNTLNLVWLLSDYFSLQRFWWDAELFSTTSSLLVDLDCNPHWPWTSEPIPPHSQEAPVCLKVESADPRTRQVDERSCFSGSMTKHMKGQCPLSVSLSS